MERFSFNVAVVEDNGMARLNLRNHLMEMGFSRVSCFSQGRELRQQLRRRHFDLILMDYHLGDNKNGVEVIQDLYKEQLIKHVTSVIFITSDRIPLIVGQIVDVHPDDLILKPYTIKILSKVVNLVIDFNRTYLPVFQLMDEGKWQQALDTLETIAQKNNQPRQRSAVLKLRARLLIKLKKYDQANEIYEGVLSQSSKVIWARWGVIHAQFLAGKTDISEELLQEMLGTHLTNDKACEWLARICVAKKQYVQAEEYIEKISERTLSLTASKLKAYLFQIQEKFDDAIGLLERKRESNKHVRERHTEFSLELARCYLQLAQSKNDNERQKPVQVARFLLGSAGRNHLEQDLFLKRHYLSVIASILEGNPEKATELLAEEGITDLTKADISTMSDAMQAWMDMGDEKRAAQIMYDCEKRAEQSDDLIDKAISNLLVSQQEEKMGERRPRALKFNKEGLDLHSSKNFAEAVDYFYQAYILFPREPAFGLNLLQAMVEAKIPQHKDARTLRVFNELDKRDLNDANRQRLNEIGRKISAEKDKFIIANTDEQDHFWNSV